MGGYKLKKSKKIFLDIKKATSITADGQKIRVKVYSCFLLLVRAFDKLLAFKTRKEKKATSPKIKQFMPKTSEIAL